MASGVELLGLFMSTGGPYQTQLQRFSLSKWCRLSGGMSGTLVLAAIFTTRNVPCTKLRACLVLDHYSNGRWTFRADLFLSWSRFVYSM